MSDEYTKLSCQKKTFVEELFGAKVMVSSNKKHRNILVCPCLCNNETDKV